MDIRPLIGAGLLACAALCAQEAPASPKPAAPFPVYDEESHAPLLPERARFDILCAENISGLAYKVYPQDKTLPPYYRSLAVRPRQRSNVYPHNAEGPLELFWYENETTPPVLALTVKPPARGASFMVALRARPPAQSGGRPRLEAFTVDTDKKSFPGGTYVVLNLTDIPLAGTVDGELLKPIPQLTKPKRARNGPLDVYAYIDEDKSIVNVTRSKLELASTYRYWLCFFPIVKNGRTKVQYSLLREVMQIDTESAVPLREIFDAQQRETP